MSYCLEVVKQDLAQSRVAPLLALDDYLLADGEAMIKVDRFGLTANNITYGVAGDMIGYWQFFPAEANWGRIPVWGTGTVINAGVTELSEGAVYYGYFPMGSYLVVKPEVIRYAMALPVNSFYMISHIRANELENCTFAMESKQ